MERLTTKQIEERIGIYCYRYAPESFRAYKIVGFSNGNKNIPEYQEIELSYDEVRNCGNAYVSKGRNAALAELKKTLRARQKRQKYLCTYGFYQEGSDKTYYYSKDLTALNNNIKDKVRAFNRIKQIMIDRNCEVVTHIAAELGAGYEIESTKEIKTKIDINRPVKINFV